MRAQSKLIQLNHQEGKKKTATALCTYINKGKKYPYNSLKRGWNKNEYTFKS